MTRPLTTADLFSTIIDPLAVPEPEAIEAHLGDALVVSFWVCGEPRPGGSKRAFAMRGPGGSVLMRDGNPVIRVVDDAKGNAKWKRDVAAAAGRHHRADPIAGEPLGCAVWFYRLRPKAHFGSRAGQSYIKDAAPRWPITKPDATKLMRPTEDSLTGVVWHDDAQLVTAIPFTCYGNREGARIIVWRMA